MTPFCIMHIDIWCPVHILYSTGNKVHLTNSMCDLTQFVVSTPTYNITAENLAKIFIVEVFLNFGMYAVIVIDGGSNFNSTFKTMCESLKIAYWCISIGEHKGNSFKNIHQFLNKTQTITGGDRGTRSGFIQNVKTSQYAWNSS